MIRAAAFFVIAILFPLISFGEEVSKVFVRCNDVVECSLMKKRISALREKKLSVSELISRLKFMALDNSIKNYSFRISHDEDEKFVVRIDVNLISKIHKIKINVHDEIGSEALVHLLPFSIKDYIHDNMVEEAKGIIIKHLKDRGYADVKVSSKRVSKKGKQSLIFNVEIGQYKVVREVKITSDHPEVVDLYSNNLRALQGKWFDRLKTKVILGNISKELFRTGYYISSVALKKIVPRDPNGIGLHIHINFGSKYNFFFRNNRAFTRFELVDILKSSASEKRSLSREGVKTLIGKKYKGAGIYGTDISVRTKEGKSKVGIRFKNFYVRLREGKKIQLDNLVFQGNVNLSLEDIKKLYYYGSSSLGSRGYLDEDYLASFSEILRGEYISRGFVFANVSDVRINNYYGEHSALFDIKEGNQYILGRVDISGIDGELADSVREVIHNKEGTPVNPLMIDNDIEKALDIVKNSGYCFAKVSGPEDASAVSYSKGEPYLADMAINFDAGEKCIFNTALIVGHANTKTEVIKREVRLDSMEIVTPQKIDEIRERLTGLGLFSVVTVTPYINDGSGSDSVYNIDLLVYVREKDFGLAEFAPGYRTDIGVKFSTLVSYNNLWGANHSLSSKLQLNQRLDYSNLDARRRRERRNRLEGLVRSRYQWPYFLNVVNLSTTLSFSRRRFYAFDADILRISPTFSKEFTKYLSSSLTYQFEKIRQFDATDEKDEDQFRIGSITPSITLDFRDDPINTTMGSHFRVSWEFANRDFSFNSENSNNEIDFSKLVSRSKFYYPYKNWVFATSLALGAQWNNSRDIRRDSSGNPVFNNDGSMRTVGYIPSIKVFRLDGFDVVRGFSDEEINRTLSGNNINELRIQNRAYFTNIKIEPRYYWSDTLVTGAFFDAGRIFVDHYKVFNLRKSVGISFKFLTAVGTLDFDYGIKLKRMGLGPSNREKFGRFHLSIGYF